MKPPTIKMPLEQAKALLKEYRDHCRDDQGSPQDKDLIDGYRALSKGRALLNIDEVAASLDLTELGLPNFAICRADAEVCYLRVSGGECLMSLDPGGWWDGRKHRRQITFRDKRLESRVTVFEAAVPSVPPRFRPSNLARYHLLWDADWQQAPDDPILLRRIGRSRLFAVMATWDLTPLEQSILRGAP